MLKIKNRIKTHEEFQAIIHAKNIKKSGMFIVYYQNNNLGYARIGISVSKKLGNAVVRNLIKRQVRNMLHDNLNSIAPLNIIIIIRKEYDRHDFGKCQDELNELIKKIRRTNDEKTEKMA